MWKKSAFDSVESFNNPLFFGLDEIPLKMNTIDKSWWKKLWTVLDHSTMFLAWIQHLCA